MKSLILIIASLTISDAAFALSINAQAREVRQAFAAVAATPKDPFYLDTFFTCTAFLGDGSTDNFSIVLDRHVSWIDGNEAYPFKYNERRKQWELEDAAIYEMNNNLKFRNMLALRITGHPGSFKLFFENVLIPVDQKNWNALYGEALKAISYPENNTNSYTQCEETTAGGLREGSAFTKCLDAGHSFRQCSPMRGARHRIGGW